MPEYLEERPVAFYPWLRQIAVQRLIDLRRRHIEAGRRTVEREQEMTYSMPDESAVRLSELVISRDTPSQRVIRAEISDRVKQALEQLPESYREALVLRFAEHLSAREAAEVLGVPLSTFRGRQFRALARMRDLLDDGTQEALS